MRAGEDFVISFPTILLRLCLALLLGSCIGIERQNHNQPAGLRTNALVALGTCLFMIISAYGFGAFLTLSHIQVDPSRIASYVVAGIGFLGAGTIFRSSDGERVKGLTTAAAIWVVAAIGLACGIGLLLEATVTTVLTLAILIVLRFAEGYFWLRKPTLVHHLRIEVTDITGQLIGEVYTVCANNGFTVRKLGVHSEKEGATIEIACLIPDTTTVGRVVGEVHALTGVRAVHIDLQKGSRANQLSMHLDEESPW